MRLGGVVRAEIAVARRRGKDKLIRAFEPASLSCRGGARGVSRWLWPMVSGRALRFLAALGMTVLLGMTVTARNETDRMNLEAAMEAGVEPEILIEGDSRLRQVCAPILAADARSRVEAEALIAALALFRARHGFGRAIAAPQIGIARRMLALELGAR